MKDIAEKTDQKPGDDGKFFASECNAIAGELKNIVKETGSRLSDLDFKQITKSINRIAKGFFYTDNSTTINAYRFEREIISNNIDGVPINREAFFFKALFTNTGESTSSVSGNAPLAILKTDNSPLTGGEIKKDHLYMLYYNETHQAYNYIQITTEGSQGSVNDSKSKTKALAIFKQGVRGTQIGTNVIAMIDTDQSFGIKSVTLDYISKRPVNTHEYYNWESMALRVYKFELSLSPVSVDPENPKYNIGAFSAGDNVLYEWKPFKVEFAPTGRPAPYSQRVIHYFTHMGRSAGLLSVLDATGSEAIEDAKIWFKDLQTRYPEWDNPFDHDSLNGQFHGGGIEWKGSHYIEIPNDV